MDNFNLVIILSFLTFTLFHLKSNFLQPELVRTQVISNIEIIEKLHYLKIRGL